MGKILDTVETWLTRDGWNFERIPDKPVVVCGVQGGAASFKLILSARESEEQLLLHVVGPNFVPEGRRAQVAEFLTRANYGLIIGNFEMDLEDGEVRYKVSVDVEGSKLVPVMVKNMIGAGVTMMDRYYPGIMAICYGGQSVAQAIKEIESS